MYTVPFPLQFGHGLANENSHPTEAWHLWTLSSVLEDLDYVDDICLLGNRYTDILEKTNTPLVTAKQLGLEINIEKTK